MAQPLGFPAVWLRHNCPCPDCRDPVTGQRLVEITQISNVRVDRASYLADAVSFGVLTATPIPFSYVDKATSPAACQPLIALSTLDPVTYANDTTRRCRWRR